MPGGTKEDLDRVIAVTLSASVPARSEELRLPDSLTFCGESGLRPGSTAVCDWLEVFEQDELEGRIGTVPDRVLDAIADRI